MKGLRFRQIHLDYHTSEKISKVAQDFDPQEFAAVLKKAHVNAINCFAKCHHGMLYYDTKFPAKHPGLKTNLLEEQINACHTQDIVAPIYVSVGFDEYIAAKHPEWVQRSSDGKPKGAGPLSAGWRLLCFNTPYVTYLEEQTMEILQKFGSKVDGFWFDIMHQPLCYCYSCMKGMEETGIDPEDEGQVKKYADQVLETIKERLTAIIRKYNDSCSIFYNSGHVEPSVRNTLDTYTHLELESLASGFWGYEHFPITVRYAKNLGKDYLGMTGRFHKSWADFGGYKNKPALDYECFTILAHGAKCCIGDQLHPTGQINHSTYDLIGSVFSEVAQKEPWCEHVKPVSEIGVMMPEVPAGSHDLSPSLRGAYRMLEEAHYQFDILDEEMDFESYKVIILPDVICLNRTLKSKLEAYVNKGGKLLLSYESGMDHSKKKFVLANMGVELIDQGKYEQDYVVAEESIANGLYDTEYILYNQGLYVKPVGNIKTLASLYHPYFNRNYKHFCSHFQTPVEKKSEYPAITQNGNIIYCAHPIFSMYKSHAMQAYKQLVLNCLALLIPDKQVKAQVPTTAHINLNYQDFHDRYVLHILHYIPERRCEQIDVIEDVIPLYNINLQVKLPKAPKKVYCAPTGTLLEFAFKDGYADVCIPEVLGHQMVVFEM